MSRTAITRGSLYNGSITLAVLHLILSAIGLVWGLFIMKEFSWPEVASCAFLLWAVFGVAAATVMLLALCLRSSVAAFVGLLLSFVAMFGFITLFVLYFAGVIAKSKALMLGDQNFLMMLLSVEFFFALYCTFAYSRTFRYLYPVTPVADQGTSRA